MKLTVRHTFPGLLVAAGLLAVALTPGPRPEPLSAAPAPATTAPADRPLDRVPADAGLFAHLSAAGLWDHPAVAELRKTYAKELAKPLAEAEKELGLRPEHVHSITFHFPKFPQGPGDEQLFVLQVVTKAPYDKGKVLAGLRMDKEKATGDVVKLPGKMVMHLTSPTQFTVTHETLLDDFVKGRPAADGALKEAVLAAKDPKNTLIAALDPSQLPGEIFTAAPPELQPFLPLLKTKSIALQARLDTELSAQVRFACENEDKAIEAQRAFDLLMKLADDGLTTVLKDEKIPEEVKPLVPSLTELQKVVQKTKAERQGTVVTARASIKADPAFAKPLVALFTGPQSASARAVSQNNLKQIGLALHNYNDVYGALPAAAIVDKKGKPLLSWRVAILPYVEQDNLFKKFKLDEPWDSENNKKLIDGMPKVFALPYGETKPNHTHYRVFVGNGALWDWVQGIKISDVPDGTSNTLFAVEAAEGVPWTKPDELEFDAQKPMLKLLRFEKDVCNILMADGSVRTVSKTLKEEVLKLLIQKDDGMPIPDF